MPGPDVCNQIEDKKEREDCLAYRGKYAKQGKKKRGRVTTPNKPMGGGY